MNKIIYWTFNIWLNIFVFLLRHRRDVSFRHIVAGQGILGYFIPDLVDPIWSSRKVVVGLLRNSFITWANICSIRFISGLPRGWWTTWILWSSNHFVIAASLWAIVTRNPLYQAYLNPVCLYMFFHFFKASLLQPRTLLICIWQ